MVSRRAWNVQEIDNDLQQKDTRVRKGLRAGDGLGEILCWQWLLCMVFKLKAEC
jgi:hypothetical protein